MHPPTVLVVDDDPDIRDSLTELLEEEGYSAVGVANGHEALQCLRERKGICLVLLDWMMPVMDGATFLEAQAREAAIARVPVVIVTAAGAAHLSGLEGKPVLAKPIQLEVLLNVVKAHYPRQPD
jgi:CheY-like chemotaxis protein